MIGSKMMFGHGVDFASVRALKDTEAQFPWRNTNDGGGDMNVVGGCSFCVESALDLVCRW